MLDRQTNIRRWLFFQSIAIGIFILGGSALILASSSCSRIPIPPSCEAMRPYIRYHNTYYYEVPGATILTSDLGSFVTTTAAGPIRRNLVWDRE